MASHLIRLELSFCEGLVQIGLLDEIHKFSKFASANQRPGLNKSI